MNLLLFLVGVAVADEPAVPVAPGDDVDEEIVVTRSTSVKDARAAVGRSLEAEGYTSAGRRGNFTVYRSGGWQPEVLLHDDGWILVGYKAMHTKPIERVKSDVYDATRDAVRALNDAVAARSSRNRLEVEIPAELQDIWDQTALPATERHARLFTYWDTRTDTPEGDAARIVVETFLRAVVQRSDAPLTPAELSALNARRESRHELELEWGASP